MFMNKLKQLMAVLGLGLMACSAPKGDLDPSQLRVEHCVNPGEYAGTSFLMGEHS